MPCAAPALRCRCTRTAPRSPPPPGTIVETCEPACHDSKQARYQSCPAHETAKSAQRRRRRNTRAAARDHIGTATTESVTARSATIVSKKNGEASDRLPRCRLRLVALGQGDGGAVAVAGDREHARGRIGRERVRGPAGGRRG